MEKNLFSAEGRITRSAYWSRILVAAGISVLCRSIYQPDLSSGQFNNRYLGEIVLIIQIIMAVFSLVQGIKRMHDIGKEGWYVLIPVYGVLLSFMPGTPGSNRYGNDPRENTQKEDHFYNAIAILLATAFVAGGIYVLIN